MTWASIEETGDTEYEWQQGVVGVLKDRLFDENLTTDGAIEAFGSLSEHSTDVRSFVRRLNVAVQQYLEHRDYLETFVEEESP